MILCLLQQVVKCIIEGPINKSIIAAVTIDRLTQYSLQEPHFLPKGGSEAFCPFFIVEFMYDAVCKYLSVVLVCMPWYNIGTGLLNTTQKIFKRFIQQISADLNFNVVFMQALNLGRFSLPLTKLAHVDIFATAGRQVHPWRACLQIHN